MDIIKNISIIFISIFFESIPFILLGSIISAIIEEYVPDDFIERIIPKNIILSSLFGVFLGFFLPACDCAVIPITKRLIKKKVPINVSISFMLSSPIINPVVLLSTYYAFNNVNKKIIIYRLLFGIAVALIVGIIMGIIFRNKDVIKEDCDNCTCHHHNKDIVDEDIDEEFKELEKYTVGAYKNNFYSNISSIVKNISEDMFDVLKYLMLGALIASSVQVLLPRSIMNLFINNNIISIIVLMLFAYLISLCSTSDSFVGRSLLSLFGTSSILAYLLLGPMIDIKNTIVLFGNYKSKFVICLISLIFLFVFLFSLLVVRII